MRACGTDSSTHFRAHEFTFNWNRIDVANSTFNFDGCRIHFYSQHAIGQSGIRSEPSKHHKNSSTQNANEKSNTHIIALCTASVWAFGYEAVETISLNRNVLYGEMPSTKLANCSHACLLTCLLACLHSSHCICSFVCLSYRHRHRHSHIPLITTPVWHTFRHCTSFVCRFTRTKYKYTIHSSISFRQFN